MPEKIRVEINRQTCIAADNCVEAAPHVFDIDEERVAILLNPETRVDDDPTNVETGVFLDEEPIWEAAEECPVDAITIFDAETGEQLYP